MIRECAKSDALEVIVGVDEHGNLFSRYPDADWVRRTYWEHRFTDVRFDGGVFVALGNVTATSPDGVIWTLRPEGT